MAAIRVLRRLRDTTRHYGEIWSLARPLRPRARAAIREATHRGTHWYRVRGAADAWMPVRHVRGSHDLGTLAEVFEHAIYDPPREVAELLDGRSSLAVLDLGAHIGSFGVWLWHRYPTAELTAVEPDGNNAALANEVLRRNRPTGASFRFLEAAAGKEDGQVRFAATGTATSHVVAGGAGVTVRQIDALELLSGIDLCKLDIEGSEWAILEDPRFAAVAPDVLTMEFHPRPDGRDPRLVARALLQAAGYRNVLEVTLPYASPGHGGLWAWKTPGPPGAADTGS